MYIYSLIFPDISLLVDCFEWPLIGHIESKEFTLCSGKFRKGGSIVSFTCVKLTFPYIILLVDCFKWALIGHIEK